MTKCKRAVERLPLRKDCPVYLRLTESQKFKLIGLMCEGVEDHPFDPNFKEILREMLKDSRPKVPVYMYKS